VILPEEGSSFLAKRSVLCRVFLRQWKKALVNAAGIIHVQRFSKICVLINFNVSPCIFQFNN